MSEIVLQHFSKKPFTGRLRSVRQLGRPNFKPEGFWVSDESGGDGWESWCRDNDYGTERLAVRHDVKLADDANLLWLHGAGAIDRFTNEYTTDKPYSGIRWADVAKRYQGIVITPYVWGRRLAPHTRWYYCWDCASGCIWDAGAIASIEVVKTVEIEAIKAAV